MFKKILAVLYAFFSIRDLVTAISKGTLFQESSNAVATYAGFLINLVPYAVGICAAVLFFFFDDAGKKTPAEGIKIRARQNKVLLALLIAEACYVVLEIVAAIIQLVAFANFLDTSIPVKVVAAVVLYAAIPLIPILVMYLIYALPFRACKKHFGHSEEMLHTYFPEEEALRPFDTKGTALANSKALYFPKLMCIVPFDQIASVQLKKTLFEQDVYFHLTNGKKFYIVSKQYAAIMTAIETAKSTQNVQ